MKTASRQPKAVIARIIPGSIAEEIGLLPGDEIVRVNGEIVSDFIEYRFAIAEEEVTLEVMRAGELLIAEIEKEVDDDLGIVFVCDVFDGMRSCGNKCVFCFEEQMPAGMRAGLRLRDDDFRLSFLHGNFITLTNLREKDWQRIEREHLSPLYISIHATDTQVRRAMLRNERAPDILAQMRRLAGMGIEMHGQIVLCPGWDDGDVLERTLADLSALHPALLSVGIVPVGLTAHREGQPELRAVMAEDARAVLATVAAWQERNLREIGTRLVYAADEFYLASGQPLPDAASYEGYPQRENGIGLARMFLDEVEALDIPELPPQIVTLGTGELAAPLVEKLAEKLKKSGVDARVRVITNHFYGGGVTVAGLLTGGDIIAALAGEELGLLILPAVMLNVDGVFLDDMGVEELEGALGVKVRFCAGATEVLIAI